MKWPYCAYLNTPEMQFWERFSSPVVLLIKNELQFVFACGLLSLRLFMRMFQFVKNELESAGA